MDTHRDERQFEQTMFGLFDPTTMGITFHNLADMEARAARDEERLVRIAKSSPQDFEAARWAHLMKYRLLQRVRVHEKAHWYTSISSSTTVARLVFDDSVSQLAFKHIYTFASEAEGPIFTPLLSWARTGACPQDIRDAVVVYVGNRCFNASVDGFLIEEHFVDDQTHLLSNHFPDLKNKGEFWNTPSYRIGLRALVEGAAKAAEWLYLLRRDKSLENEAWLSIRKGAPIYRLALDELIDSVTRSSLLEYLQLLVVVIEYSLNPYIGDDSWPHLPRGARSDDVLPGFRFVRILDLLGRSRQSIGQSKETISAFLSVTTSDEYKWKTPKEVASNLLELLESERADGVPGDADFWNPLDTILDALALKVKDPLVYVPPVDGRAIMASGTNPRIALTTGVLTYPDDATLGKYAVRFEYETLLYDVVFTGLHRCPVTKNPWLWDAWRASGICTLDSETCTSPGDSRNISEWERVRRCTRHRGILSNLFGDGLDRLLSIAEAD